MIHRESIISESFAGYRHSILANTSFQESQDLGSYHPRDFSSSHRKIMNYFNQISKLKEPFHLGGWVVWYCYVL